MKTKYLILTILALSLVSCQNKRSNKMKTPLSPPNIIIVSADDLAYNSIGAFGCKVRDISPNIDRFATEGIRFTNAHVNTPVCQPCRQSWLTGRFPHNNGAEGFEPIAEDAPTLPEQLQKAGYLNGILGKEIHHQPRERFC
jgi:N-sulfoglucosamine sulfohydrolase